ncbi:phage holin family protein [Xenorhabdus ishibashii]|uniref:Holin n=1 Tax=Xenorhabdus ishibashii TaxID=1034471 RepID=A0A2D0KC40_9GAMM|nr:phage holin family protein [Xenorhabdus ishibashii]PHM60922.1 hypothetical protein Xish_00028 [Xenorhabdus ishibashii]
MNVPILLVYINFFVCSLAVIRLMSYRRNGAQYKFIPSCIAWLLIVALGSVPLRILTNVYIESDPFEVAINVILCIQIILSDGNVNRMFRGVINE